MMSRSSTDVMYDQSSWIVLIASSYQHDIDKFSFLLGKAVFWDRLGAIVPITLFLAMVEVERMGRGFDDGCVAQVILRAWS